MSAIWKYQAHIRTKHLFYDPRRTVAICGISIAWYTPVVWLEDKEGLDSCKEGKRCLRIQRADD